MRGLFVFLYLLACLVVWMFVLFWFFFIALDWIDWLVGVLVHSLVVG